MAERNLVTPAELLQRVLAAKGERRRELAALPFEQKILIALSLQELSRPIRNARPR